MVLKQCELVGSRYGRGMETHNARCELIRNAGKPLQCKGFPFVAGVGFEPTTFGL